MSDDSEKRFYAALGGLVVDWNFAESWLRTLLIDLAGRTEIAKILTLELGAIGIENALSALAKHTLDEAAAIRVKYIVSLYSILRGYRNYWIHSIVFVAGTENDTQGFTYSASAKGKLQTHSQTVEAEHIDKIRLSCRYLGLFTRAVSLNLSQRIDPKDQKIPALPDMQPLPPEVDKSALYPQWQKQPKQQAQGKQGKSKSSSP